MRQFEPVFEIAACPPVTQPQASQSEIKHGQIRHWHCHWNSPQQDSNPVLTNHLDKKTPTYVRSLFIDYSSAFNTMQPHLLINKLNRYDVHPSLQLWILNFLTNRTQYVKTSKGNSDKISINTGGPQGCVLSAFLFIVYTNDMRSPN